MNVKIPNINDYNREVLRTVMKDYQERNPYVVSSRVRAEQNAQVIAGKVIIGEMNYDDNSGSIGVRFIYPNAEKFFKNSIAKIVGRGQTVNGKVELNRVDYVELI